MPLFVPEDRGAREQNARTAATTVPLLSEDIGKATLLSGAFTADERMAALLVSLSRRYAARGLSPTRLHLSMARTDIANYLRLAPETVSRVLRRFATRAPSWRRAVRSAF